MTNINNPNTAPKKRGRKPKAALAVPVVVDTSKYEAAINKIDASVAGLIAKVDGLAERANKAGAKGMAKTFAKYSKALAKVAPRFN